MVKQISGDQVVVMPEGSQRVIGRDAMRINIAIGYAIANIIKTTLGPKGMDKMLVSDLGDIVITNDGATILEEMNVDHPAAKLMVEIAKTQDKEVGDGTTTSVVIAGNLLKNAGELIEQTIHPTVIIKGYELAARKSEEYLKEIAEKVDGNRDALVKIALVSMGSKGIGSEDEKKKLAELIVDAVMQVVENENGKYVVDPEYIKIEKKAGGEILDTQLIKGVVIDKEVVHAGMPKKVSEAKIALIDSALEIEKTETDAKIEITSPEQMDAFLKQEEKMIEEMVDKIANSGANVVFCQKGIDDLAQHYLAKKGIMAVRRVKKSDMEKLSKATGAKIVTSLHDLTENDLGFAGKVEEKRIGGEAMIFVEECKNPKSVSIFVRGGTEHVVSEVERALVDARGAVVATLEEGSYVTGGGSVEMELSKRLMDFATEVGGREQLAIQAFAQALESIPKTLAENAGMDAIDTLVELRTKHKTAEGKNYGVNVNEGKVSDMYELGVVEPTKVKKQAIASATETARLILRIDDIISSKGTSSNQGQQQGGMPEY